MLAEFDILCGVADIYVGVSSYIHPSRFYPTPWVRIVCGCILLAVGILTIRPVCCEAAHGPAQESWIRRALCAQKVAVIVVAVQYSILLVSVILLPRDEELSKFLLLLTIAGLAISFVLTSLFNLGGIYVVWSFQKEFEHGGRQLFGSVGKVGRNVIAPHTPAKIGKPAPGPAE